MVDDRFVVKHLSRMSNSTLKPNEIAELEFLRWLDMALAGYCGETTDFRARKLAGDFGAKHLERLRMLEEKQKAGQSEPALQSAA